MRPPSDRRFRSIVLALLCVLPLSACRGCGNGGDEVAPSTAAAAAPPGGAVVPASTAVTSAIALPKGPWSDLARKLVESKDLRAATEVTREVLARGGVATFDGNRNIVEPVGPAARFVATPMETMYLAMEARHRRNVATLTAAELAQMLVGLGFPFEGSSAGDRAGSSPRGQLADDFEGAIQAEREAENDQRRDAGRQEIADENAAREAANARDAELIRRIQDATLQWQKARQALAKAPPGGKAAAEAQLQQAAAARTAAIEERNRAQQQARAARDDLRTRNRAAEADAARLERIRRLVGPNYRAGEQLMELFNVWVRRAAERPDDPRSFTPLFLAEMARLQDPPVDLAGSRFTRPARTEGPPVDLRGAPRAHQLRLTLLEIQLMAAAFYRGGDLPRAMLPPNPFGFGAVVFAQDPCSDFKKSLGALGEAAGVAASEGVGAGLEAAVEAATGGGEGFGRAMAALGMAAKIGKLVSFYNNNRITVTADPASTHKPPEGTPLVSFTATAGISEEDWNQLQQTMKGEGANIDRAARDCFNQLGLPTASDLSDLAKEAEDWLVEWRLVEGSPPHAWISLANNKFYVYHRLAMKLARSGPYSASAKLVVDILPEARQTGKIVRTYVTAQASLDAAGFPGLSVLVNAMKGGLGLADSVLDLCIGWYQIMNMPRAFGTVEVEYHCPKPATLVQTNNPVADGGGDDGPQDCLVESGK